MKLLSKEFYELMDMFELEFSGRRLDREHKDYWTRGIIYQCGETNKLFDAYRKGYSFGKCIATENKIEPSENIESLPKLTVEALKESGIEWPEWAGYATVNQRGVAFFYSSKPDPADDEWWVLVHDNPKYIQISGKWDASDWQNSLIERPAKLLPWDESTLPPIPFCVKFKNDKKNFRTTVMSASIAGVWLGGATSAITYEELRDECELLDGSPCGKLEVVEDE